MKYADSELHALAARVDKLESQNRRWKLATVILAVVSGSFLFAAAKPADRVEPNVLHARAVEAQDFILKDGGGRVRARLSLAPNNKQQFNSFLPDSKESPVLRFYDGEGNAIWSAPQSPSMIPVK